MRKSKYEWLLFDADDTLFDFQAASAQALRDSFAESGLLFLPEYTPAYERFNVQVWQELERKEIDTKTLRTKRFRLLFEHLNLAVEPDAFSAAYLKNLGRCSLLLEGAAEVVAQLAGNHRIAIITNGLTEVQRPRIEASVIRPHVEHVFISEEMGAAKPSAAFFDLVFARLAPKAKTQVMVIGDSLTADMRGGVDYGVDTCWYNPAQKSTTLPVTFQVTGLRQLLDIL